MAETFDLKNMKPWVDLLRAVADFLEGFEKWKASEAVERTSRLQSDEEFLRAMKIKPDSTLPQL